MELKNLELEYVDKCGIDQMESSVIDMSVVHLTIIRNT